MNNFGFRLVAATDQASLLCFVFVGPEQQQQQQRQAEANDDLLLLIIIVSK